MTEAGWTAERKLVEELLTFIEATSGRKLKFSTIANLKTGETEDPQHRIAAWLKRHLDADRQQGRVAAFKEVEQRFDSMFGATDRRIDSVRDYRVDKFYTWLAQAAQDEKGVGE